MREKWRRQGRENEEWGKRRKKIRPVMLPTV